MKRFFIFIALAVSLIFTATASASWKEEVEDKLSRGEFAEAMTQLKAVEAAGQTDADFFVLLGKADSALGNLDKSLADLDKAIALKPDYAEAYGHKAVVLLRKGATAEAETEATRAIGIGPTGELYYARGAVRMTMGRFKDALADLDQALALDPKNSEYLIARGEVRLRLGSLKDAETDYTRAIEVDPENAKAYLGRGGLALARRDWASARIDLDRCATISPKFSSCYLRRGKLFEMTDEGENAYKDYVLAAELAPASAEAWFEKANAEMALGKHEEAEKSARRLLEIDNTSKARKVLGLALTNRGKTAEAIKILTEAVNTDAKDPETYYLRANAHGLAGSLDKAIADLDRSIAIEKRYLEPYVAKAHLYLAKKEPAKALEVCNAALVQSPDSPALYQMRSELYEALGKYEASFADFKKAKELAAKDRERAQ